MTSYLDHNFVKYPAFDDPRYLKCNICKIIVYKNNDNLYVSHFNVNKRNSNRILDLNCNEVIIKEIIE